jgi:hypothetical protein
MPIAPGFYRCTSLVNLGPAVPASPIPATAARDRHDDGVRPKPGPDRTDCDSMSGALTTGEVGDNGR